MEDRTLPAPIGTIGLTLSGVVATSGGTTNGPPFSQSQSIDPSVGPVSTNGSSSLTGTDGSVSAGYIVSGSATATPPAQAGQPYEGDITIDRSWTFAEQFISFGKSNFVAPFGTFTEYAGFHVAGTYTLTYQTSQSIQVDPLDSAYQNGSSVFFTSDGSTQTLPAAGSGTITLSIPATGGFVYIESGSAGEGGNGSISDQESFHWTFAPVAVTTQFQNTNVLHKLLYAGQQEAVNVSVTNGSQTTVNGQEAFYLSTNANQSVDGDTPLTVQGIASVNLQPGQTVSLPQIPAVLNVAIPDDIQPGTYYLKATFKGTGSADNSVAVSPALSVCVNSQGQASSFTFPGTASVFDNAVSAVKQGTAQYPNMSSISDIEAFVESEEGLSLHPYSDNGVPAIGFGSDLIDKSTGEVNTQFEAIINAYLAKNPQLGFTFQDFLDGDPNVYIDKKTAIALFSSYFQTVEQYVEANYSGLTFNQAAALIDIGYTIGTAGLAKFTSMNADIAMGTPFGFACAGLELVNSQRTTQISTARTDQDFYLLTSAPGVADQL